MKIGAGLKYFRNLRGYSQAGLEGACGIKREYICKMESGGLPNPTPKTLKRVLDVLNVKLSEFFAYIDE